MLAGVESQANWYFAQENQSFHELFGVGETRKSITGYNIHEPFGKNQQGGTAAMALGKLANFVLDKGNDPIGLGRWCHFLVGTEARKSRIVVAYNPTRPNISSRRTSYDGKTVWEQHERYFRSRGEDRDPRTLFHVHLTEQLAEWRGKDEEVLLLTDLNENVYDGRFETRLRQADIRMVEQYHQCTGSHAPNSHKSGSKAITGCFASPGLVCSNAFIAAHDSGAGDHRYHV